MHTMGTGIGQKTLKNMENENCTLQDLEYGKKLRNVENEKCTRQDLEYSEITEIQGK